MWFRWVHSRDPDHGNTASPLAMGLGDLVHHSSVSSSDLRD